MPTIFILITSFIYGTFLESIGKAFGKTLSMQYQFHIPGPSVLGIPLLILLGWCIILSISFFISSEIFLQKKIEGRSIFLFSLFTAYTATSLDTLLDPVGIKEGNWIYRTGGGYFGVPYENFFLWFIGILLFGMTLLHEWFACMGMLQ